MSRKANNLRKRLRVESEQRLRVAQYERQLWAKIATYNADAARLKIAEQSLERRMLVQVSSPYEVHHSTDRLYMVQTNFYPEAIWRHMSCASPGQAVDVHHFVNELAEQAASQIRSAVIQFVEQRNQTGRTA